MALSANNKPWRGARWRGPVACLVLVLSAAAWAQTIRIPDLGEPPRQVAPAPKPGEPCGKCGVIQSIKEIGMGNAFTVPRAYPSDSVDRGISNMPVGAVISIPFGPGSDKASVGSVGTPEMRQRLSDTQYEITIQLDDGGYTMVRRPDGLAYHVGDRVRVEGTQLELLAP